MYLLGGDLCVSVHLLGGDLCVSVHLLGGDLLCMCVHVCTCVRRIFPTAWHPSTEVLDSPLGVTHRQMQRERARLWQQAREWSVTDRGWGHQVHACVHSPSSGQQTLH